MNLELQIRPCARQHENQNGPRTPLWDRCDLTFYSRTDISDRFELQIDAITSYGDPLKKQNGSITIRMRMGKAPTNLLHGLS